MSKTYRNDFYEHDPFHEKKSSRDKKKWYKANKTEKKHTKKEERAKTHDYLRHIGEHENNVFPEFKHHNRNIKDIRKH